MSRREGIVAPAQRSAPALLLALVVTAGTMLVGAAMKAPCADRAWVQTRTGAGGQCYSDVADLLRTEQLTGSRLPYLDACEPADRPCDEYPVVSMYTMRLTSLVPGGGDPYARFFWVNMILLLACALAIACTLERLGARTMLFAASPTLLIYGSMNWDLLPVALATVATFAFLRERDATTGALVGAGAAAKIYPALLAWPFAVDRWRRGERRGALVLLGAAAITWAAFNVPFALLAREGWSTFFRYNSARPAEFDSLWRVVCTHGLCPSTTGINLLSIVLFLAGSAWVWRVATRVDADRPVWSMGFVLVAMFLLTNKVWSPQYGLWLLPWFALVAPSFRPYLMFQAAEVAVFITRFSFFARLEGGEGLPYGAMEIAVILRAAALLWCVAVWARQPSCYSGAPTDTSPDWAARRMAAKRLLTPSLP